MADEYPVVKFVNPPGTGPIIRFDNGTGNARDFLDFQKNSSEVFSVNSAGLPDPGGGDAKRSVVVSYGDFPADSDALEPMIHEFEKAVTVTNIYLAVDTDMGDGSGANTETFVVKRSADDGTVATFVTSADPGIAQNTWQTMGAITNADVTADTYLYMTITKAGSGLAGSGLVIRVEYTLAG